LFLKLHTIIDDQIDRLLRQRGVPLPPVETRPRRTSWTSTTAAPMMGLSFERQTQLSLLTVPPLLFIIHFHCSSSASTLQCI
jgi:hypothetical protein